MLYRSYIPAAPLSTLIGCIWYSEGFEGTHERERLLPNGESTIVIDLRDQPRQHIRICDTDDLSAYATYASAVFCGARTGYFLLDTCEQERVIGIQFRPGGVFPFLDMPADEVANATYPLDDIWPREAELLREELLTAASIEAMFAILERTLLTRLHRASPLHSALSFAVSELAKASASVKIQDVAEDVGMSSRHFVDLFRTRTGLAPKAFQRVRRFQRVLRSLRTHRDQNWAALAAACGYYDQAHFIHDFRLFSGMTPSQYTAAATPHLNHVPLS